MKAVMYGGGNIGRGFIGMLFSQSGYDVTFIDVADSVVEALNREKKYPVRYVSAQGKEDVVVGPVSAVHGKEREQVIEAIANADIMATAVGVRVLKLITPNLVEGIRRRIKTKGEPLNIIICENLIDADKMLAALIREQLTEEENQWFEKNIGLVEASIGRMVPVQTEEMKAGNPLRVCVERYGFLPVDKDAFKGEIPELKNMVPHTPFDFYIERKLYVHNMGHAVCAYLGNYIGKEYIYQAMDDSDVQYLVENAMLESGRAIAKQYGASLDGIVLHTQDLLIRFTNQALKDTCARVGGDTARKLSARDRLIGASGLCVKQGIYPAYILLGAAGAVYQYLKENHEKQAIKQAVRVLEEISELERTDDRMKGILTFYEMLLGGATLKELKYTAQTMEAERLVSII